MQNNDEKLKNKDNFLSVSIFISAIIIAGAWIYTANLKYQNAGGAAVEFGKNGRNRFS